MVMMTDKDIKEYHDTINRLQKMSNERKLITSIQLKTDIVATVVVSLLAAGLFILLISASILAESGSKPRESGTGRGVLKSWQYSQPLMP